MLLYIWSEAMGGRWLRCRLMKFCRVFRKVAGVKIGSVGGQLYVISELTISKRQEA